MNVIGITIVGFVFGLLISFAGLNKNNTIASLSILKNFTVAKTIMLVLGVGGLLLMIEMMAGGAQFHVKPLYTIGTPLGGLIFGVGMAILGYCPGTLPISLGQGSIDALIGIVGGLVGGLLYTISYPAILQIMGSNLGQISLLSLMGNRFCTGYFIVVFLISMVMILGAFILHKLDVKKGIASKRWIVTGIGLAVLNVFLFYQGWMNKPMGASSSYPYVADCLTGLTSESYFSSVVNSGSWQVWFLLGAFLAGVASLMGKKNIKLALIHSFWKEYKGTSIAKRVIWAFIGGVLLIFGARMADGCTSGHIISGGMQVAISSYVFAIFTFIGFLSTGHFFYRK